MKVSYYPGCSLEGTAREYGDSAWAVCQALGIELNELDDWNCCGASAAHSTDDFLSLALPARDLSSADAKGLDLVASCAACYQRLKTAEKRLIQNPLPDFPYKGQIKVKHLLELCSEEEILQRVREEVKKPLSGLRVACYYGCLVVRPPKVTDATDFENPQNMDKLMNMVGAESVNWSYKTDCCGAGFTLSRPDIVRKLSGKILDMAMEAGAECIVTCCPMCQANLEMCQGALSRKTGRDYHIPTFYFTELVGIALGLAGPEQWLKRHLVDTRKLLSDKGLL